MPPSPESLYQPLVQAPLLPLHLTVAIYVAVGLLAVILILLFRLNAQVALLSHRLRNPASRSGGSTATNPTRPNPATAESQEDNETTTVEAGPGTPFEEFLDEDPKHRTLPKKEQFKAYRKWRADKGLNWSK